MGTMMTDEAYQKGLDALSSLISGRTRADGTKWSHAFEMMETYLQRLGLDSKLDKLSVIHVAGTKGKGSTCAMVESILRQCGYKTGLYTSPHLIDVRERIRINGVPIDKEIFLRNLWDTFRILDEKATEDCGKPAYFRFLTLLAFRIFLETKVDVVILEVGLGGRLDATNCIRGPVVCGVTALGFDHMEVLGNTLPQIAREKAGIFKPGCPAYTIPTQRQDAMEMLESVAQRVRTPLHVVPGLNQYRYESSTLTNVHTNGRMVSNDPCPIVLGLAGDHQRENASLAVRLVSEWEERAGQEKSQTATARAQMVKQGILPNEYVRGLQSVRWPGRSQIISDAIESLTFFLDGAHTPESMETCAEWYAGALSSSWIDQPKLEPQTQFRVLLFNCMSERDAESLLRPLQKTLMKNNVFPHSALFVPPESVYFKVGVDSNTCSQGGISNSTESEFQDLAWQIHLRRIWQKISVQEWGKQVIPAFQGPAAFVAPALPTVPGVGPQDVATGAVLPSIKSALQWIRSCAKSLPPPFKVQVLVTGSLYLVGDTLRLLDFKDS